MQNDQLIFYTTPQGNIKIEVFYEGETFWLTQKAMAVLFGVEVPAINKHLTNIFETKELKREATISKMEIVQKEGNRNVKRSVEYYRLEAILAVGYRVNSVQATQFRIWATNILKEFIIKGFVLDDERLKQGKHFSKDYFEDLLERIREIRASERRFYQKITDMYSLSADYNKNAEITKEFFATVQNKLHWAISGKTAAEIIYTEADATKIHMGLKTWKHVPDGKILKSDISIAKNYLNEEHLKELNAQRGILMLMDDWAKFLNKFLQISSYPILKDKGKISMLEAKIKAEAEYIKFRIVQDKYYESDFDKEIKKLKNK
jgi:hypothetical protein